MPKLLIDADVVLYRAAFAAQHTEYQVFVASSPTPLNVFRYKKELNEWLKDNEMDEGMYDVVKLPIVEPVANALYSAKHMINTMLKEFDTEDYTLYLSGGRNFRHDLFPAYKANRPPKPEHYQAVRDYLINVWGAIDCGDIEADDAMGLAMEEGCIICTIDKDLDVVPGMHYNFVKAVSEKESDRAASLYDVTLDDANYFFFKQVLTGDSTDNIAGVDGIGPVKAKKLLEDAISPQELYSVCEEVYQGAYPEDWEERLWLAAQLLWIRQKREMPWYGS